MKKRVLFIVVGIVVVIAASVTYLLMDNNKVAQLENTTTPNQTPQPMPSEQTSVPARPGAYIDYTPGVIESTPGTKLLFFHAPWCPQCRQLDADIAKGAIPDNVTILKVDFDSQQSLRMQYGVTIQTTIVHVNDNGSLIKKYVAYDNPTLAAVIKNMLQ